MSAEVPCPEAVARPDRRRSRRVVGAAVAGTVLEWFDVAVYAAFATTITAQTLPDLGGAGSLTAALGAFAVTFVVRPLGGLLIGSRADRRGRVSALTWSIGLMFAGTAVLAACPPASAVGPAAFGVVVVGRVLQGLAAGGEFAASSTFLLERSPSRARWSSFQGVAQGAAVAMAGVSGALVYGLLDARSVETWGWRLPFLVALLLGPVGLWFRRSASRDGDGDGDVAPRDARPSGRSPLSLARDVALCAGVVGFASTSLYVALFLPTFCQRYLHTGAGGPNVSTVAFGCALALASVMAGSLGARWSPRGLVVAAGIVAILVPVPLFSLVVARPTTATLVGAQIVMGAVTGLYFGPVPAVLHRRFTAPVRARAVGASYVVGTTVFGGIGPLVFSWAIAETGDVRVPGFYLAAVAALGVATAAVLRDAAVAGTVVVDSASSPAPSDRASIVSHSGGMSTR